MAAAGTPAWWSVNSSRPQHTYPFLSSPNEDESDHNHGNYYYNNHEAQSLSGLLMRGLVDNNVDNNHEDYGYGGLEYTNKYMLDFSSKVDNHGSSSSSLECDSKGALHKRPRVLQPSSPLKVRKEKLGDRITTLHQLVSPFGKTDTASVLLEVIGYIQFLNTQIQALCLPYLGANSTIHHPHSAQGERDDIFPEDPGQLVNDSCKKKKRTPVQDNGDLEMSKKDLSSRGLCLVPVACTVQVESDNGADYWAPAALGGGWPSNHL